MARGTLRFLRALLCAQPDIQGALEAAESYLVRVKGSDGEMIGMLRRLSSVIWGQKTQHSFGQVGEY